MAEENQESTENLREIVRQLRVIDNALFERRLNAQGSDERARLRAESHAVSARVERLQGLLFAQATEDFSAEVAAITESTKDVERAIKTIDALNSALGGIAGLLRIVDNVIGLFA